MIVRQSRYDSNFDGASRNNLRGLAGCDWLLYNNIEEEYKSVKYQQLCSSIRCGITSSTITASICQHKLWTPYQYYIIMLNNGGRLGSKMLSGSRKGGVNKLIINLLLWLSTILAPHTWCLWLCLIPSIFHSPYIQCLFNVIPKRINITHWKKECIWLYLQHSSEWNMHMAQNIRRFKTKGWEAIWWDGIKFR